MTRRFVSQLGERETVDEVYLACEKNMRANRQGNLYLQLRLADRTGSIVGMLWNANDNMVQGFECGDYLRVKGTTQLYNGALQMILNRLDPVPSSEVDEADFVVVSSAAVDRLSTRLAEMLRSISDPALRNLAECYLLDEELMRRVAKAPAGIKNHHAYESGLLEHTVAVMELARLVAPRYPQINADMLLMGAFLHDLCKVDELTYDRELGYSDEGQLIGHLVMGVGMLEAKLREAEELAGEAMPAEMVLRLKHMIVSHHGSYEFGSPKLPMTLEAIALTYIDNLDAKIHAAHQIMQMDSTSGNNWTNYQPAINRKLFRTDTDTGAGAGESD